MEKGITASQSRPDIFHLTLRDPGRIHLDGYRVYQDLATFASRFGFNDSIVACYAPKLLARTEVMSFDLGVWYPQKRIRNEEATELYVRLCDGDTSGVAAHPAIDAFYAELMPDTPKSTQFPREKSTTTTTVLGVANWIIRPVTSL